MSLSTGGCLCGNTRYELHEDPRFFIRRYCRDCQHVSGSGSAPKIAVARTAVSVTGPFKTHTGAAESGSALEFGFCGDCGSPITKSTTRAPDLTFIYAGSLDDPSALPAPKPVFEQSRHAWD